MEMLSCLFYNSRHVTPNSVGGKAVAKQTVAMVVADTWAAAICTNMMEGVVRVVL